MPTGKQGGPPSGGPDGNGGGDGDEPSDGEDDEEDGSEPPTDEEEDVEGVIASHATTRKKETRVVSRKGMPNVSHKGASMMEMDAYRDRGGPQPTKHLAAIHNRYCRIIDWQVGRSIE